MSTEQTLKHSVGTHEQVIQGGVVQDDPRWKSWVKIAQQDATAVLGVFPLIRVLTGVPHRDRYNLTVDLHRQEPSEYPPRHMGAVGVGLNLDVQSATALRDALTAWIEDNASADDNA